MKICGIIAEYNPFHNGHAYHGAQTRRQLGAETALIAVMTGNFVQRGDFTILDKYQRAAMAVHNGLDLVLELPLTASLSSAEDFAYGAVAVLNQTGIVTHLSFGSECGEIARIQNAARADRSLLPHYMTTGLSYAAALQKAVSEKDPDAGELLSHPNNTLGVAYCTALDTLQSSIQPITVFRNGAAHDSMDAHIRPSASFLRTAILQDQPSACKPFMPDSAFSIFQRACTAGYAPATSIHCDIALVSYLRRFSAADFLPYTGDADGLHNRLYQAVMQNNTFSAICQAAQTRRYPLARIRRTLLRTYLELPKAVDPLPHYLRVLAIGPRGRTLLRKLSSHSSLPVITKPVSEKSLPPDIQPYLHKDVLADDLFALAQPNHALHTGGSHYRKTPCLYTHK